jgi:hypothetical protein
MWPHVQPLRLPDLQIGAPTTPLVYPVTFVPVDGVPFPQVVTAGRGFVAACNDTSPSSKLLPNLKSEEERAPTASPTPNPESPGADWVRRKAAPSTVPSSP